MAEIKSTLDLVLERTKNLTLTGQEKAALQQKELEGRIRGWVQKYLDGLADREALDAEMAAIPSDRRKAARTILRGLLLERIALQGDNENMLALLEGLLHEDRAPYRAAQQHFQKALASGRGRFLEAAQAGLSERGISGSAVVPNIERDQAWANFQRRTLEDFRRRLALIAPDS